MTTSASGAPAASPHVLREIELAFNGRAPILPVRFSGVVPSSDLEYFLSRTQWLDAGSSLDEAELQRMELRLGELLRTAGVSRTGSVIPLPRRALAAVIGVVLIALAAALVWNARSAAVRAGISPLPATGDSSTGGNPVTNADTVTGTPTVKVNPKDGQAYVWIPPGRFVMGCSQGDTACEDDEKPAHAVDVRRGFWLGRTEVTRVPAPRRYYDALPATAWFTDNAGEQIHAVGQKAPNAFGLHDMLGKWVRDRYYNAYDDTSDDPEAVEEPLAGNAAGVARGGSWVSDAEGVRVSGRLEMLPDAEETHIGFRCAIDRL